MSLPDLPFKVEENLALPLTVYYTCRGKTLHHPISLFIKKA